MNAEVRKLRPQNVFSFFEEISNIPHGSSNTKKISDYCADFATKHGLKYIQDESNNIIIFKGGSHGRESEPAVILQGHLDMVCEKKPESNHSFEKDGLKLVVDGDYLSAQDTTLGGDDGIAIAMALAILDDDSISHPPIEAVFTVDEEIGLLGAQSIDLSEIKGKYLLNIDSEEEKTILIGCAGGLTANCNIAVEYVRVKDMYEDDYEYVPYHIEVCGLLGGHSGTEIIRERANAVITMGRIIHEVTVRYQAVLVKNIEGGTKDNAIPRFAGADIYIPLEYENDIIDEIKKIEKKLQNEYKYSDKNISIVLKKGESSDYDLCLDMRSFLKVDYFLNQTPCGIINMDKGVEGMVETSLNLGVFKITENEMCAAYSVRSSVRTRKEFLSEKLRFLTEFLGGRYSTSGDYPAWEVKENSKFREMISKIYPQVFDREPVLESIHAGVECGYFIEKKPDIDAVSIGPDIYDIHTTEERMSISSVERVYTFVLKILEQMGEMDAEK